MRNPIHSHCKRGMKPHNFQLNLMEVPTATGSCVILNDMFTVDDS